MAQDPFAKYRVKPQQEEEDPFAKYRIAPSEPIVTKPKSIITETPIVEEPIIEEPEPELVDTPESIVAEEPNLLNQIWNTATTPLANIRDINRPATEAFAEEHPYIGKPLNFGLDVLSGLSSPLDLAAGLTGGLAGLGLRGMSRLTKALSVPTMIHGASNLVNPESTGPEMAVGGLELLGGALGLRGPKKVGAKSIVDEIPDEMPLSRLKPTTLVEAATSEVTPLTSAQIGESFRPKTSTSPKLPRDLMGGKPRFNIGYNSYEPVFDSDLDKALYIIAQKTPSKRDTDYLKFVMEHTGLDEKDARLLGSRIRNQIKNMVSGQEPGQVRIPDLSANKLKTQAGGIGQVPPNKPPVISKTPEGQVPPSEKITPEEILSNKPDKPALRINEDGTFSPIDKPEIKFDGSGKIVGEVKDLPEPERLSVAKEIALLPRAIQSAYDLSFPFRQGIGLIHTKGWWGAWDDMIKSVGSDKAYQGVLDSIDAHPYAKKTLDANGIPQASLLERSGVKIPDLKSLSNREENIMSTWAEKIPGIKASNRGYTAFAAKLRADNVFSLIDQAKKLGLDPENNDVLLKQIGDYVNNASGRGSLGKYEGAAVALNAALFSPRLMASRLQMMNPRNYVGQTNPMIRKEYLKSMLATAGTWTTLAALAKTSGYADVSLDPNSTDFGKIRIGNTRLDPAGGFQQYLVLFNKIARSIGSGAGLPIKAGKTSTATGKFREYGKGYNPPTLGEDLVDFIQNKLAPIPGFAMTAARAEDYRPFEVGDKTLKLFTPIILQDLSELIQEDPSLIPFALPMSGIGIGSQTFGGEEKEKSSRLLDAISPNIFPRESDIRLPRR